MRPPFDYFISFVIHSDARPCIPLAGMWYAALLRLCPRHEHHHHLHRSDRGNDGAEHIGRATDRLGRIVAGRAVHHRRNCLRALHHDGHWRDDRALRAAHRWRSRSRRILDAIYPIEMASRLARGRYVCVLLITAAAERSSITPSDFTSPACRSFSLYVYVCLSIYLIAVRTRTELNVPDMYGIIDIGLK